MKDIDRKKTQDETRLKTEVSILQSVGRHPHIVNLYHVFHLPKKNKLRLVMEYCTGGELFDRLATAPYSSRDAADVTANLASALKFLHDRGIVHRDLKPENLLLVDKNQSTWIKLADFGLAKIMSKNHMFTVCGTWAYCAPEVKSQPRDGYTKAVDVWSLGVRSVRARISLQSPMNSRMLEIFFHYITPSYHKRITRKSRMRTRILRKLKSRFALEHRLLHTLF